VLVFNRPRAAWAALAVAAGVGCIALAPWLIRNALAGGNPVFPALSGIFGTAHWSAEQVSRFQRSHVFSGSWSDRLRLLVMADPSDPAGPRHRGLLHPQWGLFFPAVLVSLGVLLTDARTRAVGAIAFTLIAVQLVIWLTATHIQSRFLTPLLVTGGLAVAVAVGSLVTRSRATVVGVSVIVGLQAIWLAGVFSAQHGGSPSAAVTESPSTFSGEAFRAPLDRASPAERIDFLREASAEAFCNLTIPGGSGVLLIGDSAPFYFTAPTTYATTWDSSAITRAGDDPVAAITREAAAAGRPYILVNYAELARLERSGFLAPGTPAGVALKSALDAKLPVVRTWPEAGRVLYRVPQQGATP
jgi:hypothetical protein